MLMSCVNKITPTGEQVIKIATAMFNEDLAEAIAVKYSKDGIFTGVDKTLNGKKDSQYEYIKSIANENVAIQANLKFNSSEFISEFGIWTNPLSEHLTESTKILFSEIKNNKYPAITKLNLNLPTTSKIYDNINAHIKNGYELKYVDVNNQITNIHSSKPVLIKDNIIVDLFGNHINNFNDYKVINHELTNEGLPKLNYDAYGFYVVLNTGKKYIITTDAKNEDNVTPQKGIKKMQPSAKFLSAVHTKLSNTFALHGLKVTLIADENLEGGAKINKDGTKVM